jgi:hypothetical protein
LYKHRQYTSDQTCSLNTPTQQHASAMCPCVTQPTPASSTCLAAHAYMGQRHPQVFLNCCMLFYVYQLQQLVHIYSCTSIGSTCGRSWPSTAPREREGPLQVCTPSRPSCSVNMQLQYREQGLFCSILVAQGVCSLSTTEQADCACLRRALVT